MSTKELSVIEKLNAGTINFNDEKLRAAYALNLCTVSVSQIIDYDDVVVLEQEYEAILNNLNIERMPKDEALLKILKQLLDTITFFRIQEGDKQFIDREYQNKMKNAIWSAVPNLGLIVAGGSPVTMAVSLASQVGIGYMNYRRAKAENAFAHEKNMWQLQRAAIEQFNGLRRELFDTAWRLVDAHELPDEFRLTERQVKQYNEILMDPDIYRRYERLDTIKDNFVAYPPFWYFFGNTANAIAIEADTDSASFYIDAAKTYFEIFVQSFNACNLLREYPIASACALEYIDLLHVDIPEERKKINQLIPFAIRMSGNANDVLQLCAFSYLKIGETEQAAKLFRRLVNENYNTIINSQLLSGYYVSSYLAGDQLAYTNYCYLQERIDEDYLFPIPNQTRLENCDTNSLEAIQDQFIQKQKEILINKFALVINQFQEKYRVAFNRCIPVPGNKIYTDEYYNGSPDSFSARKTDGASLKNKKALYGYVTEMQDCDYPYNYLLVLNDMLNAAFVLNCAQGHENDLLGCVSNAILEQRSQLQEIRSKMDDPSKFTIDTYYEIIEIPFDSFTRSFFESLAEYSTNSVMQRNDIISMNEAEMNLREFCFQQDISSPEALYETANDISDSPSAQRQYLGIELIDDGVLTSEVNNRFAEVRESICVFSKKLCSNSEDSVLIISGEESFDRYFIRLCVPNKRDIQRKTVAILDDKSRKDNDLLFTTEGIMQIVKGKVKEVVVYDDIELSSDKNAIILHHTYSNANINMGELINLIRSLRSKSFVEIKDKKNPLDIMAKIIRK